MSKNHIINYIKHAQNSIINKNSFLYSTLLLFLTYAFINFRCLARQFVQYIPSFLIFKLQIDKTCIKW